MASKRISSKCIANERIAGVTMTSKGNVGKRIAGECVLLMSALLISGLFAMLWLVSVLLILL